MAERKDVLSMFFWLAATWLYVAWVRRPATWRYGALMVLTALGLMSKPMVVTLPFTLLLLDVWPLGRANVPLSRRITEKAPLFAMALAMAAITAIVQQQGGAVGSVELLPIPARVANAIVAYGHYLLTFVWPANLAIFYPYVKEWLAPPVVAASIALAVLTVLAWRMRRTQPYVLVGWLWFVGTLVPVIGLVQAGLQSYADRFTYVPYIGLLIAIAWGARSLFGHGSSGAPALRVAGAAIIVVLAFVAHAQAATWTDGRNRLAARDGRHRRQRARAQPAGRHLRQARRDRSGNGAVPGRAQFESGRVGRARHRAEPRSAPSWRRARSPKPCHWIQAVRLKPDEADLRHQLALASSAWVARTMRLRPGGSGAAESEPRGSLVHDGHRARGHAPHRRGPRRVRAGAANKPGPERRG